MDLISNSKLRDVCGRGVADWTNCVYKKDAGQITRVVGADMQESGEAKEEWYDPVR